MADIHNKFVEDPSEVVADKSKNYIAGDTPLTSNNWGFLLFVPAAIKGVKNFNYNLNTYFNPYPESLDELILHRAIYGDPNATFATNTWREASDYIQKKADTTNFNFSNNLDVITAFRNNPYIKKYNSNSRVNAPDPAKLRYLHTAIDKANNVIENKFNTAVNNMKKQNTLNSIKDIYALGGALDYDMLNQYALSYYMNSLSRNKITSMPNSFQNANSLGYSLNMFDLGGNLDFNEFNAGGTHELNTNGGILQGFDSLGIPNTVELGETKTSTPNGDYIFSDRLKLSKQECKTLHVPEGSTYAEASKILRKEYDEKPNDSIALRGWELSRDMLIQSLELLKQEIAAKEARELNLTSPKEVWGRNSENLLEILTQELYSKNTGNLQTIQYGPGGQLGLEKEEDKVSFENLKYAPLIANGIGLMLNLFTPKDYSLPNRLQQEVSVLPRVSVPRFGNYMTYNPIDINRETNKYNALVAGQRNAIMNTSNPNRNATLAAAMYNANMGYGNLVQAIEAQNAKERQLVQQFNNNLDQVNVSAQMQAAGINQGYDEMRIRGIMEELAMRDAIQNARTGAIQSNLSGLADNLYNLYLDNEYKKQHKIWLEGLSVAKNIGMRLAEGESPQSIITSLRKEYVPEDIIKEHLKGKYYNGQLVNVDDYNYDIE